MGPDGPTPDELRKVKAILDRKDEKPLNLLAEAALYLARRMVDAAIEELK